MTTAAPAQTASTASPYKNNRTSDHISSSFCSGCASTEWQSVEHQGHTGIKPYEGRDRQQSICPWQALSKPAPAGWEVALCSERQGRFDTSDHSPNTPPLIQTITPLYGGGWGHNRHTCLQHGSEMRQIAREHRTGSQTHPATNHARIPPTSNKCPCEHHNRPSVIAEKARTAWQQLETLLPSLPQNGPATAERKTQLSSNMNHVTIPTSGITTTYTSILHPGARSTLST